MHIGDPATGEAFGTSTLIYLTTSGLVRAQDGTWHMPAPEAATLYKRAAHHVARFPASALKPFRPPTAPEARVVETFSPASRPAARHQQVAFRCAHVVCGDAAEAQDAAQEGFIKAYRSLHRFREGAPFRPWLLTIVGNEARNRRRSAGRRAHLVARLGAQEPE